MATCCVCQAEFTPKMRTQILCGPACREVRALERSREYDRRRYAESPEYRARQVEKSKAKHKTDAAYREREAARKRDRRKVGQLERLAAVRCRGCGAEFRTHDAKRVYCTPGCRLEAARRRRAAQRPEGGA